jgi:hypothetical protein
MAILTWKLALRRLLGEVRSCTVWSESWPTSTVLDTWLVEDMSALDFCRAQSVWFVSDSLKGRLTLDVSLADLSGDLVLRLSAMICQKSNVLT